MCRECGAGLRAVRAVQECSRGHIVCAECWTQGLASCPAWCLVLEREEHVRYSSPIVKFMYIDIHNGVSFWRVVA